MPRKPKAEKQVRGFVVDGKNVRVSFFPPRGRERSWQVYWSGLPTRKSTKAVTFEGALEAVQRMLLGDEFAASTIVLSDEEFDEIQRQHYDRMQAKPETVTGCFEAIEAFRTITGVSPIALATAADCARFQDDALKLPKNWRAPFKDELRRQQRTKTVSIGYISRQTVLKWSTALSAAFNRVNIHAGSKCVRHIVPEEKLIRKNPWDEFAWIEDKADVRVRQFAPAELMSLLDYLEGSFPDVTLAPLAAKVFLWSYARRREIAGLKWTELRLVDGEIHFDITGKWEVRKWFRIPTRLYEDLIALKVPDSSYVFAAYSDQVRMHHATSARPNRASKIRDDFVPKNFGEWLYHRISEWSQSQPDGTACLHAYRKTGLQFAVDGDVTNKRVAADARVNVGVMTTHYTNEQEKQLREKSNRTFDRIARGLPEEVLIRYGYTPQTVDPLQLALAEAVQKQDWLEARRISDLLCRRDQAG